jgi:methenyltetrahydromethanopterin cyclohydrolase
MSASPALSVNARAAQLVGRIKEASAELKIAVARGELGETLIDAGSRSPGSIAAGLQVAEICMGGLGTVTLAESASTPRWPWTLVVRSSNPVTACPTAKARTPFSRSGPVRRVRWRAAKRCSRSSTTATTPRPPRW